MSYKSSYKSSSYRLSGRNEDISSTTSSSSSSRLRGRIDNDDDSSSYSVKYSSRRAFNDTSGASSSLDDDLTSRSSRRLTSRISTDSDDLDTPTSRYSKYKFSSAGDEFSASKSYSRYGSRDESENLPSSSTRVSRYSIEGDDDLGYSSSIRRQGRMSYLNEDDDNISTSSRSYTRRITSDSFKDSLDDSYKLTTHIDEEPKTYSSLYSSTESTGSDSIRKRYQSSASRSLTRLDSKDAGQVYEAILDYQPPRSATDEISLKEGQEVIVLSKDKQHKWKVRTRKSAKFPKVEEGFAPSAYLSSKNETVEVEISEILPDLTSKSDKDKDEQTTMKDLKKKKDMIVRELVETEEDLIRDMQFVQRTYIRQSESSITPKEIKAVKQDIFNCFKELLSFHNDVLLKNFQTLSKEPTKIGTLFIKLAPDFDNHTKYCKNLPKALKILEENSDISEFFNNYSAKIRDEKTLADHLKLPLQRISDYQLLVKELSKHLSRMDENVDDLEKAIKVIAIIPEKETTDESDDESSSKEPEQTKPMEISLPGHSSEKLSKLLKNVLQAKDYFDVIESDGKKNEKYIFLFKTRLFIAEINKNISESQRTYNVKRIVKLSDVTIAADDDDSKAIMIKSKDLTDKNYPILLKAKSVEQAKTWLDLINSSPKSDDDDKSEQNLLNEENELFKQTLDDEMKKPPTKVDENNNKINKQLSVDAATVDVDAAVSQDLSTTEAIAENVSKTLDNSFPSQNSASKSTSAGNANAENLDDTCTEATTVATDNLRSASFSSVDAAATDDKVVPGLKKTLSYKLKLQIKQPMKALTRHVGETATLECKVSPIGNLNVQWLKDNKVISGPNYRIHKNEDNYYLELSNLTSEDAGLYTIVVSNSKQSVSSSSTLNVLSAVDSRPTSPGGSFLPHAPKFKVKLKDTELLEGTTVRFELIVRGLPIPSISFFKNDKPIKEDDHLKILFQSKEVFEIMIEHVKPEDAGVYKCVAINTEGQDETMCKIMVSSDKNVFWGLNEEDTKNSLAIDNADTPRARSPLFKWFKDGSEFEASERFQVQFDDMEDTIALIFQHVKPDDAGLYTCVASTSSGKISCSAELTVQGFLRELPRDPIAPEIKKALENISVSEGESVAILEAQISGFPKPKVVWFKEKMELEASEHYKMLYEGEENYALVIKNVKDEDSGNYKLKATNELGSVESDAQLTVLKKPKIGKIPDKIEVMENEKLLIEATYEAVPCPQVKWFKDGKEIKDSGRIKEVVEKNKFQLVINNAISEDAGKYQCSVSNDLGSVSKDVDVSINSPPKLLKKLEAIEILEGEVATFFVQCSTVAKVQVEFYKEGNLVKKTDKRIVIKEEKEGKFYLTINNAQKDDEGKYKCVLKNKYGQVEDEAQLTINKKKCLPEFKEKLRDIEANVNDEGVRLEVKIDGEPKPACKWYHNGKEITENDKNIKIINDDKGSALVIPKVSNDHHGAYTCKSVNNLGQAETTGNLIVNGPPYVVKHLENVNGANDIDVKLTAIIQGNPKPEIKWYLQDKEVKLNKRITHSYDEASAEYTLFINKLQKEDLGTYRIEAKNVYGSCVSAAQVTIPTKPVFTMTLKNVSATEMQSNIEMVVQLDKQTSQVPVKWFKDNKEIFDKNANYKKVHDKLDNSYKLIILKATEEMAGNYKCVASNDCGSSETEARFDIVTKPKFIKGLQDAQYLEGDNVSMTVQISGFPKPDIAFYKNGQDVSTEATIVIKKEVDDIHVLEIENIRIIMSGEYECRIRNDAGEASSKGLIVVNSKPKIGKDLTDINVSSGEDISLEVVITGKPAPEIKWFKNGKETGGTERILLDAREEVYKLKVPNSTSEDVGIYHCTAQNKFGTASSNKANVSIAKPEYAPKFNKHIQDAVVVLNDNVRFETQITAVPQAELTWYKDGKPLKPSANVILKKEEDNDVLILKDLKIEDSGTITCKAQNAKGHVTDTAKLTVQEPTLPSILGLSDVSLVDGESATVEAIITGFPKPIVHWYKDSESVDSQLVYSDPKNDQYSINFNPFVSDLAGKYTCSAENLAGETIETFNIEVNGKKPIFIKELEESIVMSLDKSNNNKFNFGQNAIFETIVDGVPTPTVCWLKNDKQLNPNNRVTITNVDNENRLEIKEITKDDVAKYTCKAANIYGEVLSVCLLKFLNEPHAPIVKKELEDVKLEESDKLLLETKVDGEPMPAVKWLKDGNLIAYQDDRFKVTSRSDGSTSLVINDLLLSDSGKYEVCAENAKGVITSASQVLVEKKLRPPQFTKPLDPETSVEFNSPLVLEASVFGLPLPNVDWTKDAKPLNEDSRVKIISDIDGNCKLQIDNAKSADTGLYSIKAINPSGQSVCSTNLTVMSEPFAPIIIEDMPTKIQVISGEPIELHAKFSAYPLAKISWLKDNQPITESNGLEFITKPDGNVGLKIESSKTDDKGVYEVKAQNLSGEITSSAQVIVAPPFNETDAVQKLPEKLEVSKGEPLVLTAKLGDITPLDISWVKDGNVCKTNDNVNFEDKGDGEYALNIRRVSLSDSGVYALVVYTPQGTFQTQSAINVLESRQICEPLKVESMLPSRISLKPCEDLQLVMKLNSPNSIDNENVRIYKDEVPIENFDVSISNAGEVKVLLTNRSLDDSGVYRVEFVLPSDANISNSCIVQVIDDDKDKPKFKRELSRAQVESGQPCRLECQIDGNPSDYVIAWFKDDEEIVPNEHYGLVKEPNGTLALLVDSFSAKDAGKFKVQVSNNTGTGCSTAEALLKNDVAKTKPKFIDELKATSIKDKSPLVLKCKVVPSSPFEVKWYYNDKALKESDTVKFLNLPDGTVMLQINNAKIEDSGMYKVQLSNELGKSTSEAKVTVEASNAKPPAKLKELLPTTLIAGKPGFIEFQVDSQSPGDVQFIQNGKQIVPNDRVHIQQLPDGLIRLTFDEVFLGDQGDYDVIFQDISGQVKSSAPVTVKSNPIIQKELADCVIKDGCSTKFEVQVRGNPKPNITWFKNGLDLQVDSRHVTTLEGKDNCYFLVLDKCNLRDEAEYSITAVNDFGEATSAAKLTVISNDKFEECIPTFLVPLQAINAKKGDTFSLKAKINSHPVPEIIWKKDGKVIKMSDRIISNFDGTNVELIVSNCGISDFGVYELTIKNTLGEVSSQADASAFKESAPFFVNPLTDLEANIKFPTKLTCQVEGFPEPEIKWFFNGKMIESGMKYSIFKEMGDLVLIVANPTEVDSGTFECQATNSFGLDKTSANIHFVDKKGEAASFITKLNDYDVLPGGTARFVACVVGDPKPELKWFKDDQEVKIDNGKYFVEYQDNGMIKFEVKHVSEGDLGKYRCEASNVYGYDNSVAQLIFETVDGLDRMNQAHKSKKSQRRALDADDVDYKTGGVPMSLLDAPKITKMTDNSLTLLWLPSIPEQPRFPVSYVVEFAKVSDGIWVIYQSNIKDSKCDISELSPFQDYSFRVRVENKFGTSDPSPSVTAHRSNLKDQTKPKEIKSGDFNLEHIPREKIACAPKFVREEESFMFGINGQPVTIEFWVYGYPDPNITWFFENKQLEQGDKYSFMHDRNGKVCLFINNMNSSDVGHYTCLAKNEHGEEKKTIKLMHAEPPIFTKHLEEKTVSSRNHIRLECFVKGTPEPTIKWFKDFQPLADTSRMNIVWESPDHAVFTISDCITRDMGLYSCTATNLAGSTTTSAFVHVNESAVNYEKYPFSYNATIKPKNKTIEQFYDIGDELGRGTQGIVYHAVERVTGNSFSMKMMHGMGEMKQYMMNEMDIMNHLGTHQNLVQLRDAFSTNPHSLSLAMDLCGGGTLLDFILKKGFITENEVAHYIRQILEGLQYMHFKNTGHFGLTIGDILLDRINGLDVKICDFGLAKRNVINHFVEFGHPEFVSPEIVDKNSVTFTADSWSTGIVAYILLTGISPFLAENDRATLCNIQNKSLDLSDKKLENISDHGKDFLRKMLDYDHINRLDVKGALNHPWLKLGNNPEGGSRLDVIERLRDYQSKYSKWYQNASCRRYYRRRLLHSCYTHPSRMIYPPDEQYSPLISPEREFKKYTKTVSPFENVYPPNQREGDNFQSESHYQCGPDTYLLQLRDTAFPARIRRYLRFAATNSPSIATNLKQAHWGGNTRLDMSGYTPQVSIKERRKFIDVMDEEINEEIKGFSNRSKPMRLVREVGTSSYAYGQLNSLRKEAKNLHSEVEDSINLVKPFFREKLNDMAFKNEEDVVFCCYAVGSPEPSYTWFKNDTILIENSRIEVRRTSDGRCQLKIKPGKEYDVGIYKCIARNSQGSVVCRARLSLGDVPGTISPPTIKDISAHSILLAWSLPKFDGHSYIKQYKVEFKKVQDENWLTADADIKQEFYLVNDLESNTSYHFRLSAFNKFGWSQPSVPSEVKQTLNSEESKAISLSPAMQFVCSQHEENVIQEIDYSNETNPISLIKSEFKELYDFKSIIMKGKFSIITRAYIKDGSRSTLACKCVLVQSENESSINNEYEITKSLVHEKISKLLYANKDGNMFTLATELLSGLNVLTYLSRKQYYTEETVSKIVCQVLDAIEYLHYRGIGLLELQPDNVLIVDDRKLQIKLTDFANARHISGENCKVSVIANPEYIAPELIKNEEATLPYSDIWAVGVLTYILLSGHSPFKGVDIKETAQNVVFVRYLFDRLYTEVTQESIRFLLTVFKLTPHKRPTIEECFDNKWLIPNEFMMKKREMAVFSSAKLNEFSDDFFAKKSTSHSRLQDLIGIID